MDGAPNVPVRAALRRNIGQSALVLVDCGKSHTVSRLFAATSSNLPSPSMSPTAGLLISEPDVM